MEGINLFVIMKVTMINWLHLNQSAINSRNGFIYQFCGQYCCEIKPKKVSLGNIEALASEVEKSLNGGGESSANDSFHDASSQLKSPISNSTPTMSKPKPSLIPRPPKNTSATK